MALCARFQPCHFRVAKLKKARGSWYMIPYLSAYVCVSVWGCFCAHSRARSSTVACSFSFHTLKKKLLNLFNARCCVRACFRAHSFVCCLSTPKDAGAGRAQNLLKWHVVGGFLIYSNGNATNMFVFVLCVFFF